jgi:RimJ/RimL family protein N-acetyltransferase
MPRSGWKLVMGDVVTLRDVVSDDIVVFYEHQIDAEANEMAGFPARSWDAFVIHWDRILDDDTTFNRTVLVDGEVAGSIASFLQGGEREVGYWLGREFWGRGVATKALRAFLTDESRRPIYAHVARHNLASRRVLENCGFALIAEEPDDFRLALRA